MSRSGARSPAGTSCWTRWGDDIVLNFILRRIAQGAALIVAMSMLAFVAIFALGNPLTALINPASPPEVLARASHELGLDLPLYVQYLRFVFHLLHGDLGTSYITGEPALGLILSRFPATFELTVSAMLVATVIGIPLGVYTGVKASSLLGRTIGSVTILLISIPSFWVGLALVIVFGIELRVLPTGGRGQTEAWFGIQTSLATWDGLRHVALPALNLAVFPLAVIIRLTRAGVQECMGAAFVTFARAKGLAMRRILFVYVLRSVAVPIVTVVGIVFGILLAFSVVTETIFSWPGTGRLAIEAIRGSDRPVIIAYLLFTVCIFIVVNLLVDIMCALIDPRMSTQAQG